MSSQLITKEWDDKTLTFREDGYFNMTKAAKQFGKRLDSFMRSPETAEYLEALSHTIRGTSIIIVQKGNGKLPHVGTWGHPKLAVFFARWLEARFAVADHAADDLPSNPLGYFEKMLAQARCL